MMAARGGWNSDKGGKGRSKGTIDANGGGLHGVRYERDYAMITPPPGCTSNAYKERSRSPRMKEGFDRWASEETYSEIGLSDLPKDITMEELRSIVVEYGKVEFVDITELIDTKSAIIKYAHEYDAWKAVNQLNDRCMQDWDKRLRARVLERAGSQKLLIQDLPKDMQIMEVREWARQYGKVFTVDLWEEKNSKKSAIIEYAQQEDAEKAVKEFNDRYMRASVIDHGR